ncbi:S24 family peptidase [Promicromonospora sp. NPDC023987]|uniref:LexA family protein n=1 Tax=Promicromonospora sp. NPDC023987 TaxID=3155360 RepID=UPI003405E592
MTDAGISDGDVLLVDRSTTTRHGDVVDAVPGGELTVKRLKLSLRGVALRAESASHPRHRSARAVRPAGLGRGHVLHSPLAGPPVIGLLSPIVDVGQSVGAGGRVVREFGCCRRSPAQAAARERGPDGVWWTPLCDEAARHRMREASAAGGPEVQPVRRPNSGDRGPPALSRVRRRRCR